MMEMKLNTKRFVKAFRKVARLKKKGTGKRKRGLRNPYSGREFHE